MWTASSHRNGATACASSVASKVAPRCCGIWSSRSSAPTIDACGCACSARRCRAPTAGRSRYAASCRISTRCAARQSAWRPRKPAWRISSTRCPFPCASCARATACWSTSTPPGKNCWAIHTRNVWGARWWNWVSIPKTPDTGW
ncbi:hypothetical protein SDC9_158854 [bioreactor metagenome]|uniref:Uncharacterized protein n=1 Tax=bioreactor metagenome TaxID=1076179 RepID=A0A645FB58_9ZZZZ